MCGINVRNFYLAKNTRTLNSSSAWIIWQYLCPFLWAVRTPSTETNPSWRGSNPNARHQMPSLKVEAPLQQGLQYLTGPQITVLTHRLSKNQSFQLKSRIELRWQQINPYQGPPAVGFGLSSIRFARTKQVSPKCELFSSFHWGKKNSSIGKFLTIISVLVLQQIVARILSRLWSLPQTAAV